MLYNVSQLLMEPTGSTRRFELDETVPGAEDERRATGMVRLLRTHQGLLLNATIWVQTISECARCLVGIAHASAVALEEECYPTIDPSTGRRMFPPDPAEGVLHIDASQMLDLSEVLRQYMLTSEPLKSLCRQDCRGLCPECGADRNENVCECDRNQVDPRWGALSDLLAGDNG